MLLPRTPAGDSLVLMVLGLVNFHHRRRALCSLRPSLFGAGHWVPGQTRSDLDPIQILNTCLFN